LQKKSRWWGGVFAGIFEDLKRFGGGKFVVLRW
jgi:hypothetical protein